MNPLKLRLFTFSAMLCLAFTAFAQQPRSGQPAYSIRGVEPKDSLVIMGQDIDPVSLTYGLGKWHGFFLYTSGDSLCFRVGGDTVCIGGVVGGAGVTVGDEDQIPFVNAAGTDLEYHDNLRFVDNDSLVLDSTLTINGVSGLTPTTVKVLRDGIYQWEVTDNVSNTSHIISMYQPIQNDEGAVPYISSMTATLFAGSDRRVHSYVEGWNMGVSGQPYVAGETAYGIASENHYSTGGRILDEWMIWNLDKTGQQRRPFNIIMDQDDHELWYGGAYLSSFHFSDTDSSRGRWLQFAKQDSSGSFINMYGSKDADDRFRLHAWPDDARFSLLSESIAGTVTFDIFQDKPFASIVNVEFLNYQPSGAVATTFAGQDASGFITGMTKQQAADTIAQYITFPPDADADPTNELQTLANTSDATSHTATLSNSGGSLKLIEGTGITLTTGGTGLNGTATIATTIVDTDTDDQGLTLTGTNPYTIDIDGGSDIIVEAAGISVLSEPVANTLRITSTEVDGSITNEGTLGVSAGSTSTSVLTSNTSGANGVAFTEGVGMRIEETTSANGGDITYHLDINSLTQDVAIEGDEFIPLYDVSGANHEKVDINDLPYVATEVDGSTTNELQTLANTSAATTHTVTLSNSGGSVQLAEGSNITLTTTGTGLNGVVTIASTGGGVTFGTDNQVPFTNAGGTDFDYDADFTFNGTDLAVGSTDLFVDGAGNMVGIGIATPETNLHIQESNTETVPAIEVEQLSTGDAAIQFSIAGDSYAMGIDNSDGDAFKISYAATAGTAVLGTADRLVIEANGEVGIGTNSPDALLEVYSIGAATNSLLTSDNASGIATMSLNSTRTSNSTLGIISFENSATPFARIFGIRTGTAPNLGSIAFELNGGTTPLSLTAYDVGGVATGVEVHGGGYQVYKVLSNASLTLNRSHYLVYKTDGSAYTYTIPDANNVLSHEYVITNAGTDGNITVSRTDTNDSIGGSASNMIVPPGTTIKITSLAANLWALQ